MRTAQAIIREVDDSGQQEDEIMMDNKDIEKFLTGPAWAVDLIASLKDSPFMTKLTVALENRSNAALIVGAVDNYATIRDLFGLISLDHVLPLIKKRLHERFGDYSAEWGTIFPVLIIGDEAKNAAKIAESIRMTIDSMTFDERFNVTMH